MILAFAFHYFANSLWQVPLLAGCCWCALKLARASARLRYAAWIATLLLCIVMPLRNAMPGNEGLVTVTTSDAVNRTGGARHVSGLNFLPLTIEAQTRDRLAILYLALTMLALVRFAISYGAQRRASRRAIKLPTRYAAMVAGVGAAPEHVRLSPPGLGTPMVVGAWHATVWLPERLFSETQETLQAVLAHEFVHIRRRDTLVNLVLRIVAMPVAYHPAIVLMKREIQHARELLCDAEAARALPSPGAYAQALLQLARDLCSVGPAPGSAIGLFERTSKPLLEERIMTLITPPAPLRAGSRWLRVVAGSAIFSAAAATALFVQLTPTVRASELIAPPSAALQQARARISGGVMAGQLTTKVAPVYPADAKEAHITGSVVMHAIIGKDGTIASLEVVSGPAELRDSALEAVRQWVYKPYLLNGQPTEVDTTITVNYSMG